MIILGGLLMVFSLAAFGASVADPTKVVGPNACAECHKQEAEAWKGTHHFKTFREMPRRPKAKEIAERLQVSIHTTSTHTRNLFTKLGVHSRAAAVARALKDRLV